MQMAPLSFNLVNSLHRSAIVCNEAVIWISFATRLRNDATGNSFEAQTTIHFCYVFGCNELASPPEFAHCCALSFKQPIQSSSNNDKMF
jgi:hypothetical protein